METRIFPGPSGANETFSIELRPKTVGVMRPSRASVDYQYMYGRWIARVL